jgi:hypothetical protein
VKPQASPVRAFESSVGSMLSVPLSLDCGLIRRQSNGSGSFSEAVRVFAAPQPCHCGVASRMSLGGIRLANLGGRPNRMATAPDCQARRGAVLRIPCDLSLFPIL